MPYCTHCGHELPETAAYCPSCDRPTPATLASRSSSKSGGSKVVWVLVGAGCLVFAVAFMGIIAAILIPNFLDALQKAKQKRTVADLRTLNVALVSYWVDHEALPEGETLDDVAEALVPDYMAEAPRLDGWTRPIRYECWVDETKLEDRSELERGPGSPPCTDYRLASPGRDGVYERDALADYQVESFPTTDYDRDVVFGPDAAIQYPDYLDRSR